MQQWAGQATAAATGVEAKLAGVEAEIKTARGHTVAQIRVATDAKVAALEQAAEVETKAAEDKCQSELSRASGLKQWVTETEAQEAAARSRPESASVAGYSLAAPAAAWQAAAAALEARLT